LRGPAFAVLIAVAACSDGGSAPSEPKSPNASSGARPGSAPAGATPIVVPGLRIDPPVAGAESGDLRAVPLPDRRGPRDVLILPDTVTTRPGDDWAMPAWVRPRPNSGFFSEDASAPDDVQVRSVDLSWRQLQPRPGILDASATGAAQGLSFEGLSAQLAGDGPFWMRVFASGTDWAPAWVAAGCTVTSYGPDGDGQRHLPIWDPCVWSHLLQLYDTLFVRTGLRSDPRLRFVYVPGAFTWAEFDYETVTAAVEAGDLDWTAYQAWHAHAWRDLADLFGPYRTKLVFTGEDFPFGPFGSRDDLLASQATAAGLGIRTGITELSNFHLSQAPAYGSTIAPDGHLRLDETLPVHDGRHVVATENECYTACGFSTGDPYYAVRQSNLKALQLHMNWVYVVPGDSFLAAYRSHWDWVRLSLGATPATAPDAWAVLRDAQDTYWSAGGDGDESAGTPQDPGRWRGRPTIRNLERWLVQVDRPGSTAHPSRADVHTSVLAPENGTAAEGLSTSTASGDTGFAFRLDRAFATATSGRATVLVTYLDAGRGAFRVRYPAAPGPRSSAPITRTGSGQWRTARVPLPGWTPAGDLVDGVGNGGGNSNSNSNSSSGSSVGVSLRIGLDPAATDLTVRMVRVVRMDGAP
jgi:hypothetical protein